MATDARMVLQQRLSQQLVMTPQLRQAIKILQVSRAELETLIDQEMIENPVLEEKDLEDKTPDGEYDVPTVDGLKTTEEYKEEAPAEIEQASNIDQIDWKEFAENYSNDSHGATGAGSSNDDDDDRRPAIENIMVKRTLLPDHLMWQLRLSDMSEDDKEIAVLIVGSLDQDGYLTLNTDEIAFISNVWPYTER